MRMLRTISETAVAISVASVREKPSSPASARACARAGTRSSSDAIATWTSPSVDIADPGPTVEDLQAFLEIQRGVKRLEIEVELDHSDRHVRPDADDDRLGAAKARGERDGPQGTRDERVDDVQRGDVDDDSAGSKPPYAIEKLVAQLQHALIAQGRLDHRDQVLVLLEDRDAHGAATAARRPD